MIVRILSLIFLTGLLFSCENGDWEFADHKFQLVYFPYQTPVRTLILGNYDQGFNDNDNNHCFEIGVVMTGVYKNDIDRKVYFTIDKNLIDTVANVKSLPARYYSLETLSPVIIPAGEMNGRIKIQLTEEFFEDSLSFAPFNEVNYVIPIVITDVEGLDSIARGKSVLENPVRVIPSNWDILPMDYTLFGIKFKNKYHATYLRRGVDTYNDTSIVVYRNDYVERDEIVSMNTSGNKKVQLQQWIRRVSGNIGEFTMELVFGDNDLCTVNGLNDNPYNVSGSGEFIEDGDEFGGKKRDVVHLNFSYTDTTNNEIHQVFDTLVVRDRTAVFEEFTVEIKND